VLRAIGDPVVRLREDPLRMLRAVRFAAQCALTADAPLRGAFARALPLLETLSAERVYAELTAAFTAPGRGRALRELIDLGAASIVLPEAIALAGVEQSADYHPEGDVLTHVCLVLDQVSAGDAVQAWAAVVHDLGKPQTFARASDRIRFHGHDQLSAAIGERILQRLRAPRELRETVVEIARDHIRFASLPQWAPGRRERWLRAPRFCAHLAFHRADCLGSHGDLRVWTFAAGALAALPPLPPPPLCTGGDVLALGVPEGPMVGEILRALRDRLDALGQPDRLQALALLAEIVRERIKTGSGRADTQTG
jgi:poly(A) polymerase